MLKRWSGVIAAASAIAVVLTACSGEPASTAAPTAAPAAAAASAAPGATAAPAAAVATAMPPPATAAPTATAESAAPRFTHPIEITNPFYPISLTGQAISLGQEGGKPSRNEVTLLPDTKLIDWNGRQIEARTAQFVAYTDGRLVEVAYDYFAQADDGSVYYLGEDVDNYAGGQLVSHEGSWLAGKDGAPPALIMPAQPAVGQIFNPENLPGVVYEQDEIVSLSQSTTTPAGPTDKGILVKETLMDGSIEHKVYAADFGIIEDRADDEQVSLVLFSRADAKAGAVPEPLAAIEAQAEDIFDVAGGGSKQVAADVAAIAGAWQIYQARAAGDRVPQPFQAALAAAIERLQKAAAAKDGAGTLQAANDLSAAVADLLAVYHPATPADLSRLDVLGRQVLLDVAATDFSAAADSLARSSAVWARLKPVILAHGGAAVAAQFESSLATQQQALRQKSAAALTSEATNGLELVDALEQLF